MRWDLAFSAFFVGSASSTSPHGIPSGAGRTSAAVSQEQAASGALEGSSAGASLTSRDAILRVIRRNLDSRRMPPQSTKDGEDLLSRGPSWVEGFAPVFAFQADEDATAISRLWLCSIRKGSLAPRATAADARSRLRPHAHLVQQQSHFLWRDEREGRGG